MGFVWSAPVSSKESDRASTKGGGNRIISGGVQNRFWGGVLWYVFPSPEFPPPLCFSLTEGSAGVSPRVLRGSAGFCTGVSEVLRG